MRDGGLSAYFQGAVETNDQLYMAANRPFLHEGATKPQNVCCRDVGCRLSESEREQAPRESGHLLTRCWGAGFFLALMDALEKHTDAGRHLQIQDYDAGQQEEEEGEIGRGDHSERVKELTERFMARHGNKIGDNPRDGKAAARGTPSSPTTG